jgi:hypothetical protein
MSWRARSNGPKAELESEVVEQLTYKAERIAG